MSLKIDTVRVFGFRGLKNIEVQLEYVTVLTGMNNSGKTSFLKALQIALGNRQFITPDDFHIVDSHKAEKLIVDLKIIPIGNDGNPTKNFEPDWEILLTEDKIRNDTTGNQYIPLRTIVEFDEFKSGFKSTQFILNEWSKFSDENSKPWYETDNGNEKSFYFDEIPFFYIDAQRDIIDDLKVRNSYIGKLLSNIKYSDEDIKKIEKMIAELNEKAVGSSDVLSNIEENLKELNDALENKDKGIDITPFPKKVRDLNKGISIQYSDFSMEYHGMGTRSWSSILTLKAFIRFYEKNSKDKSKPYFPIIAIEEPEAHLHPNAQKKLYSQIKNIYGQKIITTHSPYICSYSDINGIRGFYKKDDIVTCGRINKDSITPEDLKKLQRMVINHRGEIFFSSIVIFFEGVTEEQALPVLAEKYFAKPPNELGIDFVGVGGHGNYRPFIIFAESFNIPWIILSDAETKIQVSVRKQLVESKSKKTESDCIFFLGNGNDFEKQLIDDDFRLEIKAAFKVIDLPLLVNQSEKSAISLEIDRYTDVQILDKLRNNKTKYAFQVALEISKSNKTYPPIIKNLFGKIKAIL